MRTRNRSALRREYIPVLDTPASIADLSEVVSTRSTSEDILDRIQAERRGPLLGNR
jgi:hypothetical protein